MNCNYNDNGKCKKGKVIGFGCPQDCEFATNDSGNSSITLTDMGSSTDHLSFLTYKERQLVKLCRKIRKLALMNRVDISRLLEQHRNSDNLHLFKFIELCGVTIKQFMENYLLNLQPFQLELQEDQQYDSSVKCIIDFSYNAPVYLKVEFTSYDFAVISFHENQNEKLNLFKKKWNDHGLAFAEVKGDIGVYTFGQITLTRGISVFTVNIPCQVVDNSLVKYDSSTLASALLLHANQRISFLIGHSDMVFSDLKQISITSFGETLLNDISILVDAAMTTNDSDTLSAFAIVLDNKIMQIYQLPNYEDVMQALNERYSKKAGPLAKKQRLLLGLE